MEFENLLTEEIQAEIETLKGMELGSEPYKVAVDGITKLIDRSIDIEKYSAERKEKAEEKELEVYWKERESAEEKKDRRIKDGIAIAGIVLPIIVTIWGTKASFKFEDEDLLTNFFLKNKTIRSKERGYGIMVSFFLE